MSFRNDTLYNIINKFPLFITYHVNEKELTEVIYRIVTEKYELEKGIVFKNKVNTRFVWAFRALKRTQRLEKNK